MGDLLAWCSAVGPTALAIVASFWFVMWSDKGVRSSSWGNGSHAPPSEKPYTEADWERGHEWVKRWLREREAARNP